MAEGYRQFLPSLRFSSGQFTESGRFALVGTKDTHGPARLLPLVDLSEEIAAALLEQNDIANGKIAEWMIGRKDLDLILILLEEVASVDLHPDFWSRILNRD